MWRNPVVGAMVTVPPGVVSTLDFLQRLQQGQPVSAQDLIVVPLLLGAVLGGTGCALRGRPNAVRFSAAGVALTLTVFAIAALYPLLTALLALAQILAKGR
jgi:hypothetical protein